MNYVDNSESKDILELAQTVLKKREKSEGIHSLAKKMVASNTVRDIFINIGGNERYSECTKV